MIHLFGSASTSLSPTIPLLFSVSVLLTTYLQFGSGVPGEEHSLPFLTPVATLYVLYLLLGVLIERSNTYNLSRLVTRHTLNKQKKI
jgi:hypothetical protein